MAPPAAPTSIRRPGLWTTARSDIADLGPADTPELRNVERGLREFESLDPGADGFRYPLARDGENRSLPGAPEHVNLIQLHESTEALSDFLSAVRTELKTNKGTTFI